MKKIKILLLLAIFATLNGYAQNTTIKPFNGSSLREYRGMNRIILIDAAIQNNFQSQEWFTQDELMKEDSNLMIAEGQKGTMIFSNRLYRTGEIRQKADTGEDYEVQIKKLSYYYVFNKDQLQDKKAAYAA